MQLVRDMTFRLTSFCLLTFALASSAPAEESTKGVWTNPNAESFPRSFKFQGEYATDDWGAQVIALSDTDLQVVVYKGGLPGAGWDGKHKSLFQGAAAGLFAAVTTAEGDRKYLAKSADQFSATRKNPPEGQFAADGFIKRGLLHLKLENDQTLELKHIHRASDTIGKKAPAGAIVLFDGTNKDHWDGGRVDEDTKLLNTDGKDMLTKQKFNNYRMHLEFMLPFRPDARGQGRGNSGFYQVDHYEMQILDSFGLDGVDNECGGIYQKANPKLNMCLPPLVWQSYDVEFHNAVADADGKKTKNARLTAYLNGVMIHDKLEIDGKTGGSRGEPEGTPGPIKLQGHGNPLQFRNIWIEAI